MKVKTIEPERLKEYDENEIKKMVDGVSWFLSLVVDGLLARNL